MDLHKDKDTEPSIDSSHQDAGIERPLQNPPSASITKRYLWIGITMSAIAVIALGFAISYLITITTADTKADNYLTNTVRYLDTVYDTATAPADDPDEIIDAIMAIEAPALETSFISNLSDHYSKAEIVKQEAPKKITQLREQIAEYGKVYEFHERYITQYNELQSIDDAGATASEFGTRATITQYLKIFQSGLKDLEAFCTNADVPADLKADMKRLGSLYGLMHEQWSLMTTAFANNNQAEYDRAYDAYATLGATLAETEKPLTDYYNNLSSKTKNAAKSIRTYRESLQK